MPLDDWSNRLLINRLLIINANSIILALSSHVQLPTPVISDKFRFAQITLGVFPNNSLEFPINPSYQMEPGLVSKNEAYKKIPDMCLAYYESK